MPFAQLNLENLGWTHIIVSVGSAAIGAVALHFFRFLGNRHQTNVKSVMTGRQMADAEIMHLFDEHQKLRNDLMKEVLENREQLTTLREKHMNCVEETSKMHSENAQIKRENMELQRQIAELRGQVAELRRQLEERRV
jgi:predicted RNase H-like nuclease (RuvC/YqgF family)